MRRECPACRARVPVNKDGSLRKHPCAAAVTSPEPDAAAPESPIAPTSRPAGCYVDSCRRPEMADGIGLCVAHYVLRPDLRKVARHG